MLSSGELESITSLVTSNTTPRTQLGALTDRIRAGLNPHPGGQKETNVPVMDGAPVPGMQHKYRDTVLFFPTEV
jgi:hypothetical protein